VVYKARQKSLDRLVALKILAPERKKDDQFAERFSREAKILASLSQVNIVTVHDFGETGGMYYLVMELVDGVNLRQLLKKGLMTAEKALAIVPDICMALEYAHQQGVVHRDIKPENVLLDKQGRVKIADFGIAKILGKGERSVDARSGSVANPDGLTKGERLGTPSYMAPEQMEQPTLVDHRADIYSLGIVFYEMLTGELPAKAFQPPSRKVAVDVRIDEAVIRAIEKEPERRYQTAAQLKGVVETVTGEGAAPASVFDWRTWSPGQSEKAREICSHMTESERKEALQRDIILGLMLAVPLSCIYVAMDTLVPSASLWFVVALQAILLVISLPILIFRERRFLCSTSWARKQGLAPDVLRRPWEQRLKNLTMIAAIRRRRKFVILSSLVLMVSMLLIGTWLQRPRPLGMTIAASTPDNMLFAGAQTFHAMRIFGGDKSYYRFHVQGYAGAIFEVWTASVPREKLAVEYTLLSRDDIQFDGHGSIVWSDDGLRVSFRVNDVEVSAFNAVDSSHTFQGGFLPQREVELSANEKLQDSFLDLDTGMILDAPSEVVELLDSKGQLSGGRMQVHHIQEWMRQSGADLVCRPGMRLTGVHGLSMGMEKTGVLGDPRAFDTVSTARALAAAEAMQNEVEKFRDHIARQSPNSTFSLDSENAWIVRTREGGVAVVELLNSGSSSNVTRLRYKLVEQ
jgi:predicted Ser/Thr protein kinase